MAKELPYFKFEPAEYLTKDVSFCSLAAQGLFINLCSYYWQRSCKLSKDQFLKRLNHENELEELISEGAIDLIDNDIYITFLDVQFEEVVEKSKVNKTNGSKGGRPNLDDNITTIFGELIPREPEEKDHFLYLFKRTSNNTYKIGETQDLFKRRNTMKISSKDLSIIHFVKIEREASLDIERDVKNRFLDYNIGGDWFDFKGSDIQLVINAINEAKKPNRKPIESESKGIREDKIREEEIREEKKRKEIINTASPFKFFDSLISLGGEKQLVSDWITVRKLKKLSNTETAFHSFETELKKSNKTINEVLKECVVNSWGGFKAEWINKNNVASPTKKRVIS